MKRADIKPGIKLRLKLYREYDPNDSVKPLYKKIVEVIDNPANHYLHVRFSGSKFLYVGVGFQTITSFSRSNPKRPDDNIIYLILPS